MKIQDALSKNLDYWVQELEQNQKQANKHMEEATRFNDLVLEAQKQIALYTKAQEILTSLDQVQVDAVKVEA